MAVTKRHSAADIAAPALNQARSYAFYQLVELLHRLHDDDLENQLDKLPEDERFFYTSTGSLGFPASDITLANQTIRDDGHTQYEMEVSFLGMQGSASPLPGYFLDSIAYEYGHNEGVRHHFLNFFNHRLVTLLHRSWRKYRYFVRFQPDANDGFSALCYSLIGLNEPSLRSDTTLPWSRLLTFTGLIASRNRSPAMVSKVIAHCFDLEQVEITEWVHRYVDIAVSQQSSLGMNNFSLGEDIVVGERVSTRMGKFAITLKNLTLARFKDFLPNGKDYPGLLKLVEFLLKDPLAYNLELGLKPEEVPLFQLQSHSDTPAYLGWSTFAGHNPNLPLANVILTVRQ
ncbi:MAG: type VI secretion system baseplate subunit TssG [Methylococcaceae bacterium]